MERRKRQYSYNFNSKDSEYPLDGMLAVLFLLCNIRAPPEVFSKSPQKRKENTYEGGRK